MKLFSPLARPPRKRRADLRRSLELVLYLRDPHGQRRLVRGRQGLQSRRALRYDGPVGLSVRRRRARTSHGSRVLRHPAYARRTTTPRPPWTRTSWHICSPAYSALRARRPELTGAQIVLAVDAELKRAGRVDEEERFYREALAGALRLEQVVGVFMLAARRGDVDGLIQLTERCDRLQTGRAFPVYATPSFRFPGPAIAMCQGMSVCADKKLHADVLRLVDYNLAAVRRKNEHQSPAAAARAFALAILPLALRAYLPTT